MKYMYRKKNETRKGLALKAETKNIHTIHASLHWEHAFFFFFLFGLGLFVLFLKMTIQILTKLETSQDSGRKEGP